MVEGTLRDLRQTLRTLARSPTFAVAAVVSLALGIGPTVAIFSVIDAALLHPLPYAEPDRLVAIHGTSPATATDSSSYPNYLDWRSRIETLEDIGAWRIDMFTLAGQAQAERVIGGRVSASYFHVLRATPLIGRTFDPAEDQPGAPPLVLLGESLWRRSFGADPRVLGQSVTLDGTPHTIIGVMPAHVGVGVIARRYNDVFLPIGQYDDDVFRSRHVHAMAVIGRLGPDIGLAEARADLDRIAKSLEAAYPEANKGVGINVQPLEAELAGHLRPPLAFLMAAVAFVLLIACANVSSLIVARFTGRSHEFALRAALGASRWRLFLQAVGEGLCLAVIGGSLGIVLAVWGTRAALSVIPSALPDSVVVQVNVRGLVVAAVVIVVTGLLCVVAPMLRAVRQHAGDVLTRRSHGGPSRHRTQQAFLVAQIALAFVLLVSAGLMTRTLAQLWRVDPGFDPGGVLTFMTGMAHDHGAEPQRVRLGLRRIAERLAEIPGVQATSAVFGALPYSGNNNAVDFWREDQPRPVGSDAPLALFSAVGPEYFRTLGIPLLKGRALAAFDTFDSPRVAIVDAAFARRVFPEMDPVGRRIHLEPFAEPVEIVGVVGTVKHWGIDGDPPDRAAVHVYVSNQQLPDGLTPLAAGGFSVVVLSSRPTAETLAALRATLREFDSGQAMNREGAMHDGIARSLANRRFSLILIGTFALLALGLSTVGIYGLASHLATERTAEIGVRVALGAQRRDIVHTLLEPVGGVAFVGIGLGLVASLAVANLLAGMLFGVSPTDPFTTAGVALLFISVTLVASYGPARRALAVDPIVALRHE